ncbi:MAG: sulfatase-like hydrolase/transferase [Sedimentisphaerales bacterium]|nr:sulfatase-like hydrolase/transferase [Sedimentisphaerales bacterium]
MENKSINRRDFMKSCAVGASILAGSGLISNKASAADDKRPNIVLIVSDDHGLEALGCYGNKVIKTPNLDQLAAEGVRFTNAFCTTASCSASRSVILTGMYNHANGQYGHQHSFHHFISFPNIKSLPVLMAEAGYRTGRIGKYHVAPDDVYRFDVALGGNSRSPVEMANNCREFISSDNEKPFFLYFCMSDPHRGGGKVEEIPTGPDRFGNRDKGYPGVNEVEYSPEEVIVPPFLPDSPECRAELAQYYKSVCRVDQGVGRLIDVLKESGKYDNTVVIYISDNGVAFPGAKTTVYEPGMRLPCIIRNPAQRKKGITCNALINYADLAPTIMDFADALAKKNDFHGRSFKSVLEREKPWGWDVTYASHTFHEITMYYPMRVVRERRFKLIWNIAHGLDYPFASDLWASSTWQAVIGRGEKYYGRRTVEAYIHRPKFELYDLENDPDEVVNLADDPEHKGTLTRLQTRLKEFQKRTNDPWIVKWEYE